MIDRTNVSVREVISPMSRPMGILWSVVFLSLCAFLSACASDRVNGKFEVGRDRPYECAGGSGGKLDIYFPTDSSEVRPAILWFHGGGWSRGSKNDGYGQLIPFLEAGWVAVNADYRLMPEALAPAAVLDCRCALRWLVQHAAELRIDKTRIVVGGTSSGAHLALVTGMLPEQNPLEATNANDGMAKVAAVLDFYGPTDLFRALDGASRNGTVARWIGDRPDRVELAQQLSPLLLVRKQTPPVFIVHGDADRTVPYGESVRLHEKLDSVGIQNRLHTVRGGGHGGFESEENARIIRAVFDFLIERGIMSRSAQAQ
jgi:acetyl esterase/lipase